MKQEFESENCENCEFHSEAIHKVRLETIEIITCVVKAGEEQNPLSLDSPGLRRIAGLYYRKENGNS